MFKVVEKDEERVENEDALLLRTPRSSDLKASVACDEAQNLPQSILILHALLIFFNSIFWEKN